jgi:hypothetical protein
MKRFTRLFAAAAFPALAGCYTYAVVPVEQVPVGSSVRARISDAESRRLERLLGGGIGGSIRGELLVQGSDSLLLGVRRNIGTSGHSSLHADQRVFLPRDQVFELEVRRLSKWRTASLVAAGAVAAYVLAATDLGGLASGGSGGSKTGER